MTTRISRVMVALPTTISVEAFLRDAVEVMREGKFRHLPVVSGDRLVGIISERDTRLAVGSFPTARVREYMTVNPYCLSPDTPVTKAISTMIGRKIGCTVVVDSASKPVGIFTMSDGLRILRSKLYDEGFLNGAQRLSTGIKRTLSYLIFALLLFFVGALVSVAFNDPEPIQTGREPQTSSLNPVQAPRTIIIVAPKSDR